MQKTRDKGGNGSIDEVFHFSYDANDRLTTETKDADNDGTVDQTTTFGYDRTQEIQKTVVNNASGNTTSHATFAFNLQGPACRRW